MGSMTDNAAERSEPYTEAQRLVAAASQVCDPLDGDFGGARATVGRGLVGIEFAYSPRLARVVKSIPRVAWDARAKMWVAPLEEYAAAKAALGRVRELFGRISEGRADIESQAKTARPGAKARDAYAGAGAFTTGPIVAANAFFCAQETGSGAITIHDLFVFNEDPAVGEDLYIKYNDGGRSAAWRLAREPNHPF